MRYCTQCGGQLEDGQRFCKKCGSSARAEEPSLPMFYERKESVGNSGGEPASSLSVYPRRRKGRVVALVIALLIVLMGAVGGVMLYFNDGLPFLRSQEASALLLSRRARIVPKTIDGSTPVHYFVRVKRAVSTVGDEVDVSSAPTIEITDGTGFIPNDLIADFPDGTYTFEIESDEGVFELPPVDLGENGMGEPDEPFEIQQNVSAGESTAEEETSETDGEFFLEEGAEEQFGIATDSITGSYVDETLIGGGMVKHQGTTFHLNDTSSLGALYVKSFDDYGSKKVLCVYLDEDGYQGMGLYAAIGTGGSFTNSFLLAKPHAKSRWYFRLDGSTFTFVEMADYREGFYDGHYYLSRDWSSDLSGVSPEKYVEEIRVMDLREGFNNVLQISRMITPPEGETLDCEMKVCDRTVRYAAGYTSYTDNTSAVHLDSEQEFCDQVYVTMEEEGVDWIRLAQTSWTDRWNSLELDEEGIAGTVIEVTFKCDNGKPVGDTEVTGAFSVEKQTL